MVSIYQISRLMIWNLHILNITIPARVDFISSHQTLFATIKDQNHNVQLTADKTGVIYI